MAVGVDEVVLMVSLSSQLASKKKQETEQKALKTEKSQNLIEFKLLLFFTLWLYRNMAQSQ